MSRPYQLDTSAASAAGQSNYIAETGKYIGQFVRAECVISKNHSDGVELDFVADDGRSANYLSLWTHRENGEALMSFKVLSAVMACLKLRELTPGPISYKDRDGNPQHAEGFAALCGKPIGVLLQKEEYRKRDDKIGFKFNLIAPFDAKTELTAGEILARKTSPEQLPKMVATLRDKPMAGGRPAPSGNTGGGYGSGSAGDMDDDIPFANPYRGRMSYIV